MRVQVNITKESNNVETCTEKMGLYIHVFINIIQMQMLCINSACSIIQQWIHNTFKTASSSTNIRYAQLGCRQNSLCQSYLLKKKNIYLFFFTTWTWNHKICPCNMIARSPFIIIYQKNNILFNEIFWININVFFCFFF